MARSPYVDLARRERQIMDAIYRLERATVADVLAAIDDPPSYSAVRAMLGKLEEKGHLGHEQDGPRYVYFALQSPEEATGSALRRMIGTFFHGSAARAVAAVLDASDRDLSDDELDAISSMIEDARRRGR